MATKITNNYAQFGCELRALRLARDIATPGKLAQALGISAKTVSAWECGTSRPSCDQVPEIAELLGESRQRLLTLAGYGAAQTAVSFAQPLPLHSLTPVDFERFCHEFLAEHFADSIVHRAGKEGHKQFGIDIDALRPDGATYSFQSKRVQDFGAAKVRSAVLAHTYKSSRKHILLSSVASPSARTEIRKHRSWDLWDQEDISRMFRRLAITQQRRLVDIYFPGQRFALLGIGTSGRWLTFADFFSPHLGHAGIFNHHWQLVGRQQELAAARLALSNPDIAVICLTGVAGNGKTRILKSIVEEFHAEHPKILIRMASPTADITLESLEELGDREKVLIVDDVQERSDLGQLARYTAETARHTRLLLIYRPYWSDQVERELAKYALTGQLTALVPLLPPTKQDARRLAEQVLASQSAPLDAASIIADHTYDSPLAVVVGAQIVARDGLHPELFGLNDEFRAAVFRKYEQVITDGLSTSDSDKHRIPQILRILALVQPVIPDDREMISLISAIENIDAPDVTRISKMLIEAGVLFRRGAKFRLSPDLLADSIIETSCISSHNTSNGYAEKLFRVANPEQKEHILLNLGRLDWRRNRGDTSHSDLLDGLWASLKWDQDNFHSDLNAATAAAYFQPRQAVALARRLLAAGYGSDEAISRILRNAAYSLSFVGDACSLLWSMGQMDGRPLHQHPNHPVRIIKEMATPDPRTPTDYIEEVVTFALSIIDLPESWIGPNNPLDILDGALVADGHFTTARKSTEITSSRYVVERDRVSSIRRKIIDTMLSILTHENPRCAYLAATHLHAALRGPLNADTDSHESWDTEFVSTLETLNNLLDHQEVRAAVLVRVAESVSWHAFFGSETTKPLARKVFSKLDRDLETRTVRALMDGWGSRTWPLDADPSGTSEYEGATRALCLDLASRYHETKGLTRFVSRCLEEIHTAGGDGNDAPVHLFLHRLLSANSNFAIELVRAAQADVDSPLSPFAGRALAALLTNLPEVARGVVREELAAGDSRLQLIAQGYAYCRHSFPYDETDIEALHRVFSSKDATVLAWASGIVREIAEHDKKFAVDLVTQIDIENALVHSKELFMWLAMKNTLPLESFTDDQLSTLVAKLRTVEDISNQWICQFLQKCLGRVPSAVIDLAKTRLDDTLLTQAWYKAPLGNAMIGEHFFELTAAPGGVGLVTGLLDWALPRCEDYMFTHSFSQLLKTLCGSYDDLFVATLENWLKPDTLNHYAIVSAVLREAGSSFIYRHDDFVARIPGRARRRGRDAHEGLVSALYATSVSGLRSGVVGEPFVFDLKLRAHAEARLATLSRTDPAYILYRRLSDHAQQDIDRQAEQKRRMMQEDEGM